MKKQVAVVTFPSQGWSGSSKVYNFLTNVEGLNKGDTVVVDTVNGLTIANFVRYDDLGFGATGNKTPTKWLIQKVDLEAHEKRIEAEKRLAKIKVMMENERKKAQELEIYEILAKTNPEMKSLLEEFKQIQEVL